MITHETELKLQAFLDGEITAREAAVLKELLGHDPEARSLFEEMKSTRMLLVGNELDVKLSETREFYWSKIRRQIEVEDRRLSAPVARELMTSWWVRFLVPTALLTALVVLVVVSIRTREGSSPQWAWEEGHEIETPLEETSSFSFRSEAAAMTVVWVDSHHE